MIVPAAAAFFFAIRIEFVIVDVGGLVTVLTLFGCEGDASGDEGTGE